MTQPTQGEVHAFSAICTHAGCTVAPGEGELLCPCHQSRYALTDAAVLGGPAPEPLPAIQVEVSGEDVVLA
ncbi:ubiquinol-cytochrome c reductase iron-sulfur subunit [Isoptericola sp. QY 916]|uniref:QcrA and Rieske domain-containing protein n=1 Tax=Isoptericola sp. QY 916 TaxID=2782570 RepID=UPI003D2FF5EC|nr:Rieske (2Fe-2S) protein [Isoptericola sp. QY 916]